jgi:NADH-quinone oxidoreductase subunit N
MNWTLALPEIVLSLAAMAILIFGVLYRRDASFACNMLALGALLLTAFLVLAAPVGSAFGGLFVVDAFARFAKLLIIAGSALALMLSLDYNRHEGIARFEFPVLILFAVVGMMVMVSAANLMTLYVGLELHSLALYVVTAFNRDSLRSSEAGLKYFVLGALASGLLLYGISLVYGFSGSMSFAALGTALAPIHGASAGLVVGIVFVIAGLVFKVSRRRSRRWRSSCAPWRPRSGISPTSGAC